MYEYRATLVRVVDGDTIDIDIDLGFHISLRQRCRLAGVNAPETRGSTKAAGDAATDFVRDWLPSSGELIVQSSKPYGSDKYGRFLVRVLRPLGNPPILDPVSLNEALLSAGHAVHYME